MVELFFSQIESFYFFVALFSVMISAFEPCLPHPKIIQLLEENVRNTYIWKCRFLGPASGLFFLKRPQKYTLSRVHTIKVLLFKAYIVTYIYSVCHIKWGYSLIFPQLSSTVSHGSDLTICSLFHSFPCYKHSLAWFLHLRRCLILVIHGQRFSLNTGPQNSCHFILKNVSWSLPRYQG